MLYFRLILLGLVATLLAGCPSTQTIPDSDATAEPTYEERSTAETGGLSESGMGEGEFIDDPFAAGELANVIYFDFDSSEIRPEDTDIVARHAIQLRDNPAWSVRLEGHADERGSREYNIGLGERRAQTVRRMLLIQGASASQIVTVSFGEERPAAFGSDEDAYAQNRRVEFKYTN
jgi:peptidoglycan-associated lipoprotein